MESTIMSEGRRLILRAPICLVAVTPLLSLLVAWVSPHIADAQQQQSRVVPRDEYLLAVRGYYTGEYRTTARNLRSVAAGGIRSTEGRWVDSICYHTMAGECYYQMGELALALEQYDAALALAIKHRDWMMRVQFPQNIGPSGARPRITWGASARRSQLGNFPDTISSFQGRLNNEDAFRQGGVVTPPTLYPLRVTEVVRCTGLALYRRWELMGPTGEHTPLSQAMVDSLAKRSAPANHWSQVWIEAQLGLAQAANGKRAEAVAHLQRAVVMGGEFDHHLTPIVLLSLGKLFMEDNNLEAAANYFLEASFAAAALGQPDVIAEAFRHGLTVHIAQGAKGAYPPLVNAIPWAKREGFDALEAWLYVLGAESYAAIGDARSAGKMLDEARRALARSEAQAGDLGARYKYQLALAGFQQGNSATGTKSLNEALRYQQKASLKGLQIALADKAFVSGTVSARIAKDLYARVLNDPTPHDWATDPLDSLAVLTTPLDKPMENWFLVAISRKEHELALEISERIRRRRFFASLPLGGRLLSLRWLMEAPEAALSPNDLLRRRDLAAKYPEYAKLQRASGQFRAELTALDLVPADARDLQQQKKLYADWSAASGAQEVLLSEIALRREPADLVFPPIRTLDNMRAAMPQKQLVLAFFNTSRGMVAFLFTHDKYVAWQIEKPGEVVTATKEMLKSMGHFDGNHVLDTNLLRDEAWKDPAARLLPLLIKNAKPDFWDSFDELVIVPDGLLWYLPFEALQVPLGDASVPLVSKIPIRYAPTVGLSQPDGRGRLPAPRTAIVAGQLFPRDDGQQAQDAAADIQAVSPKAVSLADPLPATTALQKTVWDQLVVLDDVDDRTTANYLWSPAQIDQGKAGSRLADWFTLPFGAPETVVLPGFHTAAENSLKRPATGNEIFLSLCGLMASGTRTILISRWRTGGQTSFDLTREFIQELPRTAASKAWRRSVLLARSTEIDPQREPRIKLGADEDLLRSDHPFFWSGYLLVDTGLRPKDGAE